jgi:hypothetical protein
MQGLMLVEAACTNKTVNDIYFTPYCHYSLMKEATWLLIENVFKTAPTTCIPKNCSLITNGSVGCNNMNLFINDTYITGNYS